MASADRTPLVPTAAAFVGGGDRYRNTVLRDASEVRHAARGSRHRYPEGDHRERRAAAARQLRHQRFRGVRDYAILTLVARLCLRSIAAARLQLDDLDWRAGRIVLQGKASRGDGMPLPADAREALSTYLRQARPATGEPPGVSTAVLVGVAVGVEPDQHPQVVADGGAQLGISRRSSAARDAAVSAITTSNGSPTASDTQVATAAGAGTSTCLSVRRSGWYVRDSPKRGNAFGPSSAEELDFG